MLITTACRKSEAKPGGSMPIQEVGVVTVTQGPLSVTTELPGRISAPRTAEVRARVDGILLKQLFQEGAEVKAGQVLFQIDPAPLAAAEKSAQASVARAQATLKQALSQETRYQKLVTSRVISAQDYEDIAVAKEEAQADLLTAMAALETAQLNLGYTTVTAPISGRIGKVAVTEGAYVRQTDATLLVTIKQLDPIYFDFTQSSTEVLALRRKMEAGQLQKLQDGGVTAALVLEDGSLYSHEGKLLFSDSSVDETTGMITLRAEFPNPETQLLPGMFAQGRVKQAVDEKGITIPQRAVIRSADGGASVLVVGSDQKVASRAITTGDAISDKWVVKSGLEGGEQIIVEGLQKVMPGTTVTTVPFQAPKDTSTPSVKLTADIHQF